MSKQNNSRVSNTIEAFLASEGKCMELNLSNQTIEWNSELCSALVSIFKISKLLQCINLHGTQMSSDVLNYLVEGLVFCKRLVVLDLSNNNIDDEGATAIAQLISNSSKRMSLLSLHVNEISDIGSDVISTSILESKTSLSTNEMKITLYNNNLTETGVTKIQETIGSVCNIEAQPQNVAESKSNVEKSPSRTGVLHCSPKKMQKAEEEVRLKLEEEARLKAEEEERLKLEEEARLKAEEEERLKLEEEVRLKAEEEARLRLEEEARLKAEEEVRLKLEEEVRLKAEEEARLRLEEEARLKAEEEARLRLEEEAKSKAEPVIIYNSNIGSEQSINTPLLQVSNNSKPYNSIDKDVYEKEDTNLAGESDNCCCCCVIC